MLTITEIYNNIPCREGLTTDWGFSCLLNEAGLLFDTGERGDVLRSGSTRRLLGASSSPTTTTTISAASRQFLLRTPRWRSMSTTPSPQRRFG